MAFQATKWGWKGLAARLLLVPVLAGSAAGVAAAQAAAPADKGRAAQAPGGDPKDLLKRAKQALAAGQLDQAQDYATKANQAAAAGGSKWGLFEDTPASVMKDVQEARAKADRTRSGQLFKDAKAAYAKAAKTDAERMAQLDQALMLAHQAKNLHGPYSVWEFGDKPDKLISEIETAKAQLRKKMPAPAETVARTAPAPAPAKAPAGPVLPVAGTARPGDAGKVTTAAMSTPAKAPAPAVTAPAGSPAKAAVAQLVADGRAALSQDRLLDAKAKAAEARRLADEKGLSTAFGPNEDSPEALHQACVAKGRAMIAALTTDAQKQTAAKKYAEAEAALDYAQQLSDGLGLYSKPIHEQRSLVATLAGKPAPAEPALPSEVPARTPAAEGTAVAMVDPESGILPGPEPAVPVPGGLPPITQIAGGSPKPLPQAAPKPPAVAAAPKAPVAAPPQAPTTAPVQAGHVMPKSLPPAPPPALPPATAPKAIVLAPASTPTPTPPPARVTAPMPTPAATAAPITPVVPVTPVTPAVAMNPPAAPAAPAPKPVAAPPAAPAAPAPAVNLIEQSHAELRRGDLEMARKIAIQAHNGDPASKAQAQALLREIDAEDTRIKQKNARMAFDSGLTAYAAKRYDNALGIFKHIDPAHLPADQKAQLARLTAECEAQTAAVTPASGQSAPGVARIGGGADPKPAGGDSLIAQQKALADVAYQKLRQDGFEALNAANAAWGRGETDAAIQALTDYAARVKASSQPPSQQALLLRPIDERAERYRLLKHHTDFLAKEAKDKADVRRDMLTANVAEAQKQEEIKRKVKQVNELTKAAKYKEAELAALQAKQLDPDNEVLTAIAEQAKFRRRSEDFKQIRSDQEKFNLAALNEAEKTGPAVTAENPVAVNPEAMMRAIKRGDGDSYMRARTPQEQVIENRLSAPFSFKFDNQPLRSVIDEIRTKSGLNIVTDDAAIDDEKVSLAEVTITEEVKDLSLRDGLAILLGKARLAFVVENNVVKVTTEKRSRGRLTTKVFHVMDLVTPIPEYKPADHHTLNSAIAAGRGMVPNALGSVSAAGSGGVTPHVPAAGLNGGQMVSAGTGVPGQGGGNTPFLAGGTLQNNLQSQPVAMSPQRGQYAEQLKKLITGMVRPYAWQAMGGAGNLEYYDIGGALVVNQTADVIREVNDLLEALRRLQDLSVSVEVRVISLSEAFFERVGVDFAMNIKTHETSFERMVATSQFRPEPFLNDINNKGVLVGFNPARGGFTPDLDIPIRATSYGMTVPPFGGYQGALSPTLNGGVSLGLAFLNDIQVYMFLEAAQGNRRVNVMQAPKITLFNGQTATVFVGDVAYFTTGLSVFNVGGQFVYIPSNIAFPIGQGIDPNTGAPGGVSVTVQAVISADRRFVRMNLSPTLTALASATVPLFPVSTFITPVFEGGSQGQPVPFTQFFQQPSFSEITAQTTVAVPDGGTVLLGGLKTLAQARNEFGPPVISHIPYLNRLFKNVGVGQETRHVMMMVTPRIIINAEEEVRQVGEGGGLLPPQQ